MKPMLEDDYRRIVECLPDKNDFHGTKWLITGVTGMVGSYLLSFLSWLNENELNHTMEITAIHRGDLSADHPNIRYLLNKSYIRYYQLDLSTDFQIDIPFNYDYVIHGASNAAPKEYLKNPISTINTNIRTTQKLLDCNLTNKELRSFLYISSGEIYGEPTIVPTPEDYIGLTDHLSPRSCYVEAKKFGETLCWNYATEMGIPVKVVRPVHIFGPGFREGDSRVWADFLIKAAKGLDLEIMGDGLARRGFCYMADAITQLMLVLLRGSNNNVYNIGNSNHISIKDLANEIKTISPRNISVIIKNDLPSHMQGSPNISCPSVDKVYSLGKTLNTSLSQGLERSLRWYVYTFNKEEIL